MPFANEGGALWVQIDALIYCRPLVLPQRSRTSLEYHWKPKVTLGKMIRIVLATLISAVGACASLPSSMSGLELRETPMLSALRVTNRSHSAIEIGYGAAPGFPKPEIFFVRFRDSMKQVVQIDGATDGWWTPAITASTLRTTWRTVIIPAMSYLDFDHNIDSLTRGYNPKQRIAGPCEVQFLLSGRTKPSARMRFEVVSDWRAAPCPEAFE